MPQGLPADRLTAYPARPAGAPTKATGHVPQHPQARAQRFRAAVCHALTVGVSVLGIASAAGITRGRVYQIRDGRR